VARDRPLSYFRPSFSQNQDIGTFVPSHKEKFLPFGQELIILDLFG
jgi:hypothetical protein